MITRRGLLIVTTGLLLPLRRAFADQEGPLQPGDKGYKHHEYHPFYEVVFGPHCRCGDGDCRVTDWRETKLGSKIGYDVLVNREWYPLPDDVYIPPPHLVPTELRRERAHICAYIFTSASVLLGISIPCAIINVTQS